MVILLVSTLVAFGAVAQSKATIYAIPIADDVKVTIDQPVMHLHRQTIIIMYALPNGNTTEQTMGKIVQQGDDWHFDIQHIKAQTQFIRHALPHKNIVVAYFENTYKSWPQYKKVHDDYPLRIVTMVDRVYAMFKGTHKWLYLNGHSGGGSFILGYLQSVPIIPKYIRSISFLDSNYGYDSSFLPKFQKWLQYPSSHLQVFAYNDSVALLNGKTFVTATGGTWYRSHLMMQDLSAFSTFRKVKDDSLIVYKTKKGKVQFFFKTNPNRQIFHTVQVALNGFIHSVLCGTRKDSKGYTYFGDRAYANFIEN